MPSFKPALGPPSLCFAYTVCVDRAPFPYLGYWNDTQDSQGLNLYAFSFSPMTFFNHEFLYYDIHTFLLPN